MIKTAYCKINLTLEILGTKRADGFHDLKTVMHKIPLGDIIELNTRQGTGRIDFSCDIDLCPKEDNLAYRAAEEYLKKYSEKTGKCADVSITLKKITPFGAGLGGGSADAATVLDMLTEKLGELSQEDVFEIASGLGSDVPFCLERHVCAYCTGRGEDCRDIDTLPKGVFLVVAKPIEGINTKGIYGEYDKKYGDDYSKSKSDNMERALANSDFSDIARSLTNDFETVCIPRLPEIDDIKKTMMKNRALCSQMSGSGSAVFGLFDNESDSKSCFDALKKSGLEEVYEFTPEDFEKMYKGE